MQLLDAVFDHLDAIDVRVYRLAGSTIPYGTHPDLPHLDYRRQLDEAAEAVAALGAKARRLGLRLSTHPGQYTVLNALDEEIARKAALDLEQDAALFDAMELGAAATIVLHVGGAYGGRVRDLGHGPAEGASVEPANGAPTRRPWPRRAAAAAAARPARGLRDAVGSRPAGGTRTGPLDVVVEEKAKDLAVFWLREQCARVLPELAAAEDRTTVRRPVFGRH